MKTYIVIISIIVLSFIPKSIYSQIGTPSDLTKNIYQDAIILSSNGDTIQCHIRVLKKDTLHHSDKVKYEVFGKKHKIRLDKVKLIELGNSQYITPIVDKYPKLCSLIVQGKTSLYVSFHLNLGINSKPDHNIGFNMNPNPTIVSNKADYIMSDFYILKNERFIKIDDQRNKYAKEGLEAVLLNPKKREHKYVLKILNRVYPDCIFSEIETSQQQISYDEIPELIVKANQSCFKVEE